MVRPDTYHLWVTLLGVFFLGTCALWVSLDRSPGAWDDAWYLTNSLTLYDTLVDRGFIAYWKKFLGTLQFKAPLIAALPTPLYRLLGRSSHVAYGVNLAFMVLLFAAVYRLARRYSSPRGGVIAVYLAATMPLLYGLSRQYLVEYGLTALVAATICHLGGSSWLRKTRSACWLGVLCGLGVMMKITFPVYVLLPFLFAWLQSSRTAPREASDLDGSATRPRRSLLMPLLAFASPLALIALPWYARNWSKTLDHALQSSFSPMADLYGMGNPFSIDVIQRYLTHWVNDGISGAYFLLLVTLTIATICRRTRLGTAGLQREARAYLTLWFLPFLLFLLGRNKDIRFTAPLLPAVAITLAWMADSVLSPLKKWRIFAFTVALAFPLLAYLQTSFGFLGNARLAWGELVLLAPRLSHAGPPERQPWPHREILKVLRANSEALAKQTVMLGSDTLHFNANNFELAAAEGLGSFQISTSAYEEDLPSLLNAANSTMFLVYKEGGEPGPQFTNRLFNPLLEYVRSSGKFFDLSAHPVVRKLLPELPDGGKVVVFKNKWPNSPIFEAEFYRDGVDSSGIALPATRVNFSNVMRLTGLVFGIEKQWLKVVYRWQCIGKPARDLLCFTHILDDRRKIVGFLDHVILGDPDLMREQGWAASESLRYRLPEGVNQVHLRLGLFRSLSGERLSIQESSAEGITVSLTDQGTAIVASGMTHSVPSLPPSRTE